MDLMVPANGEILRSVNEKVSSYSPNMRFAAAFLDYTFHRRAVPGETLMDQRTGELVHKRKSDGKLIYYGQENFNVMAYYTELKTLAVHNRRSFIRPSQNNCDVCDSTYFFSYMVDLIGFTNKPEEGNLKLLDGGTLYNPYPEENSIIQETNGMFLQLNGRPRDRALIAMLNSVYNKEYKDYAGDDPEKLAKKEKFDTFGFEEGDAVVNYTIRYYDAMHLVYAEQTADAYVKINELSYVPFKRETIYKRTEVTHATVTINSISVPKLAEAMQLIQEGSGESRMFEAFLDNDDIGLITCGVSYFIASTDDYFHLPVAFNTAPMFLVALENFEDEFNRIGNISGSTGLLFSIFEPDEVGWSDISIWGEIVSTVHEAGETDPTGSVTVPDQIEHEFGKIEYASGRFTLDADDPDNYYIERIEGTRRVMELS